MIESRLIFFGCQEPVSYVCLLRTKDGESRLKDCVSLQGSEVLHAEVLVEDFHRSQCSKQLFHGQHFNVQREVEFAPDAAQLF